MLLGRETVIKLYIVAQRINKQAVSVQATSASILVVGANVSTRGLALMKTNSLVETLIGSSDILVRPQLVTSSLCLLVDFSLACMGLSNFYEFCGHMILAGRATNTCNGNKRDNEG